MLYESMLLLGVIALGFLAPLIAIGMIWKITLPGQVELIHLVILLGIYFVGLWRRNGQTLAMQTWQLQLVRESDGKPPTLHQCLIRYVLCWPSTLLILCGAGLIWAAFFDRNRQFMHDRLSGTCVVHNPSRPSATE